ncbi:hypothetical protein, partial [Cedecea sp. VD21]
MINIANVLTRFIQLCILGFPVLMLVQCGGVMVASKDVAPVAAPVEKTSRTLGDIADSQWVSDLTPYWGLILCIIIIVFAVSL